jgi:hypothetical protein
MCTDHIKFRGEAFGKLRFSHEQNTVFQFQHSFPPSNLNKLQHDTEIVIRIPGAEYGARGRGVGEHILSSRGPVFAP